jgi:hypothetical protein
MIVLSPMERLNPPRAARTRKDEGPRRPAPRRCARARSARWEPAHGHRPEGSVSTPPPAGAAPTARSSCAHFALSRLCVRAVDHLRVSKLCLGATNAQHRHSGVVTGTSHGVGEGLCVTSGQQEPSPRAHPAHTILRCARCCRITLSHKTFDSLSVTFISETEF